MSEKPLYEFNPTSFGSGDWGIPVNVPASPTLGLYVCSGPTKPPGQESDCNQYCSFNATLAPGAASGLYMALCFQLPKWGWQVEKPDEWIEVSPTHKAYYEATMATKQMLEGVIKTGLSSAAAAVADYELIAHDLRKYREVLEYFKKKDEHSLKAMFIDQVDIHTGDGISMRSIAPRWPTIIADFVRLKEEEDVGEIAKTYEISRAEAVILATKNKLYKEWKKMFFDMSKNRYEMLSGLVAARQKSVEEYRNWLRPQIARFKAIRLGGAKAPATIFKSFAEVTGISTFSNGIRLWAWRPLKPLEPRKAPTEIRPGKEFAIDPLYDDYVRQRFILDPSIGLAKEYTWLREPRKYCAKCKKYLPGGAEKCDKCGGVLEDRFMADEIVETQLIPAWKKRQMKLDPAEPYYVFMDIDIFRCGTKLPVGELEDITFNIRNYVISQNIMLVKLLELKCREKEFERYIDEMLGVRAKEGAVSELIKREYPGVFEKEKPAPSFLEELTKTFSGISTGLSKLRPPSAPPEKRTFMWIKPGPYERDFAERITKQYATPAAALYNAAYAFLRDKVGMP